MVVITNIFCYKSVLRIYRTQTESNIKQQYWFTPKVQKSQRVSSVSQTSQTGKLGIFWLAASSYFFIREVLTSSGLCASKANS